MNIRKILTIVITLVMGIALTGVLATNVNNVDNDGYIEFEGEQYESLRVVNQDDFEFAIYINDDVLISEPQFTTTINAINVFVSDFSLDTSWYYEGNDYFYNKNHKTLNIELTNDGDITIEGNSNGNNLYLSAGENILGGEFTISVNEPIKPNVLTLLSLVPLIFTGAVVYFVYNSRFD